MNYGIVNHDKVIKLLSRLSPQTSLSSCIDRKKWIESISTTATLSQRLGLSISRKFTGRDVVIEHISIFHDLHKLRQIAFVPFSNTLLDLFLNLSLLLVKPLKLNMKPFYHYVNPILSYLKEKKRNNNGKLCIPKSIYNVAKSSRVEVNDFNMRNEKKRKKRKNKEHKMYFMVMFPIWWYGFNFNLFFDLELTVFFDMKRSFEKKMK